MSGCRSFSSRRRWTALSLTFLFATFPACLPNPHAAASEVASAEPKCSLNLAFAQRILDAFEAIQDDLQLPQRDGEWGIDAYLASAGGTEIEIKLTALGFTSFKEWYQCLVALEDAYLLASIEKSSLQFDGTVNDDWDSSVASSFIVNGENLEVVYELMKDERYLTVLKILATRTK